MADDIDRLFEQLERQLNEGFRQVRSLFEEGAARMRTSSNRHNDPLEALQQLKRMRELDLINEQEYQEKKAEILKRL